MKIKLSKRLVSTVLACLMVCALLPVTAFAESATVTAKRSNKITMTVSNTDPEIGEEVTITFQNTHVEDRELAWFEDDEYWCTLPERYYIYLNNKLYYTVNLEKMYDDNRRQNYLTLKDQVYSTSFIFTEPVEVKFVTRYCYTVYEGRTGHLLYDYYGYWDDVCRYSTPAVAIGDFVHTHEDTDEDGFCDGCGEDIRVFSVTLPASMPVVMDESGRIFTADSAKIVNNSNLAVSVSEVKLTSANGWAIVPYTTNMANVKVDSQKIGFKINGTSTRNNSKSETLRIGDGWKVEKNDSLSLTYDAVVSPVSAAVNSKQVLNVSFIVDWARKR